MSILSPSSQCFYQSMLDENRRRSPRYRVLKPGQIMLSNATAIECSIRDLGLAGAKLFLSSNKAIPDFFQLLIVKEELIYPCKCAWRGREMIGTEFLSEPMPFSDAGRFSILLNDPQLTKN